MTPEEAEAIARAVFERVTTPPNSTWTLDTAAMGYQLRLRHETRGDLGFVHFSGQWNSRIYRPPFVQSSLHMGESPPHDERVTYLAYLCSHVVDCSSSVILTDPDNSPDVAPARMASAPPVTVEMHWYRRRDGCWSVRVEGWQYATNQTKLHAAIERVAYWIRCTPELFRQTDP